MQVARLLFVENKGMDKNMDSIFFGVVGLGLVPPFPTEK